MAVVVALRLRPARAGICAGERHGDHPAHAAGGGGPAPPPPPPGPAPGGAGPATATTMLTIAIMHRLQTHSSV